MKNAIINKDSYNLSPYDNSLPLTLLKDALSFQVDLSQKTTESVYNDIIKKVGVVPGIPKSKTEKTRLVVALSDKQMKEYSNGTLKLAQEKGEMVAQLKVNGKYGKKLPIKEEKYNDGSNLSNIQNALQLQAIQQALEDISKQIEAIDENVKEVLKGLQNDRLGLYYSGVSLFIESQNIVNKALQEQLLVQSVKTLSDSIYQMMLTIKSDISYLQRSEYDKDKKHKYDLINEKIKSINTSFEAIHQASIMKAAIYCYRGEINAMISVLQEYQGFIDGTIVANAEMLAQCDINDKGKLTDTWKSRANFKLGVNDLARQLNMKDNTVMYLEGKEAI